MIFQSSLRFQLLNGEDLPAIAGLSRNYRGLILNGAQHSNVTASFGSIVIQEYSLHGFGIAKLNISWNKPERLICYYDYPSVLFCRTMLRNSMYELPKGSGSILLKNEQFMALTGNSWSSVIISEKAGEHEFIHLWWPVDILNEESGSNKIISVCAGLPERINTLPHVINIQMKRITADLLKFEYGFASQKIYFQELMMKYLKQLVLELREKTSIKKRMSTSDWFTINRAKLLIDETPEVKLSTPQLSQTVGMNEYKLKKLFRKVTGYPIDEYRKYVVFTKAGKTILENPDVLLKNVSVESGYNSPTAFIRAFKSICNCTPGELRDDSWDVSRIADAKIPVYE